MLPITSIIIYLKPTFETNDYIFKNKLLKTYNFKPLYFGVIFILFMLFKCIFILILTTEKKIGRNFNLVE